VSAFSSRPASAPWPPPTRPRVARAGAATEFSHRPTRDGAPEPAARLEGFPQVPATRRADFALILPLRLDRQAQRSEAMTKRDDIDPGDPKRLVILAYTRLVLLHERPDGSKQAVIASFGAFEVRLTELPPAVPAARIYLLWIELCDCAQARVINAIGCRDLDDAGEAAEVFVAEAKTPAFDLATRHPSELASRCWPSLRASSIRRERRA
jgi:hypothetical protein